MRDRIIYGELFSLIPLESNWCRGYMMLQTEEGPLVQFVEDDKTHIGVNEEVNFRDINQVLGEVTNLVWGHSRTAISRTRRWKGEQRRFPSS